MADMEIFYDDFIIIKLYLWIYFFTIYISLSLHK